MPEPAHGDAIFAPFWEAAGAAELRLPRCLDCGHRMYPPAPACTECLSANLEWAVLSGRGSVVSFIVYHRAWQPAWSDRIPYNVALIALEEGPQIVSSVTGCPLEEIAVGMPVAVTFEERDDRVLPMFTPRGEA